MKKQAAAGLSRSPAIEQTNTKYTSKRSKSKETLFHQKPTIGIQKSYTYLPRFKV